MDELINEWNFGPLLRSYALRKFVWENTSVCELALFILIGINAKQYGSISCVVVFSDSLAIIPRLPCYWEVLYDPKSSHWKHGPHHKTAVITSTAYYWMGQKSALTASGEVCMMKAGSMLIQCWAIVDQHWTDITPASLRLLTEVVRPVAAEDQRDSTGSRDPAGRVQVRTWWGTGVRWWCREARGTQWGGRGKMWREVYSSVPLVPHYPNLL